MLFCSQHNVLDYEYYYSQTKSLQPNLLLILFSYRQNMF